MVDIDSGRNIILLRYILTSATMKLQIQMRAVRIWEQWRDLNGRSLSICCEGVERIELQPFSKERGYCFNLAPHHDQGRVG